MASSDRMSVHGQTVLFPNLLSSRDSGLSVTDLEPCGMKKEGMSYEPLFASAFQQFLFFFRLLW